jgi:hypothetical protein
MIIELMIRKADKANCSTTRGFVNPALSLEVKPPFNTVTGLKCDKKKEG